MRGNYLKTIGAVILGIGLCGAAHQAKSATEIITVPGTAWRYLTNGPSVEGHLCASDNTWTLAGYDDSAWIDSSGTGNGLFGLETAATPLPINTPLPRQSDGSRTDYFRTKFNWAGGTSGVVIYGTNYIDDGIIVYLNGTEVFRQNMGDAAAINYAMGTLDCNFDPGSAVGDGAAQNMSFALPAGVLLSGENTMAVELHQSGGNSSDKMFGLWLFADETSAPEITTQPVGADVNEGDSYTLTVVATGLPLPTYQWYLGPVPIDGATGSSYTIASMSSADAGSYTVVVDNGVGSPVTSAAAQVNFVGDITPPVLVDAVFLDNSTVQLTFDEPLDPTFSDNTGYGVFPEGTEILPDDFIAFVPGNLTAETVTISGNTMTWGLGTAATPGGSYFAVVDAFSIQDNSEAHNQLIDRQFADIGRQFLVTIIPYDGSWYYDTNEHHTLPAPSAYIADGTWKDSGFDAAGNGWPSGPGMFGTEGNLAGQIMTKWNTTADPEFGPFTVYAVTTFTIDDATQVRELTLNSRYDDGCVVYLNGVEVLRKGVPANQTYQTTAASHESSTVDSDVLTGFVTGVNTLAVEVHQTGEGSSDIVWGAELIGNFKSISTSPVEITQHPEDVTVDEGDSASFHVQATGGGLSYQWKHNGDVIPGATDATLTLTKVGPGDAGQYTCEVDNADPSGPAVSNPATLTVVPVLMTRNKVWSYDQSNTDLADGWEAEGFDDSAWPTGPAPLGRETSASHVTDLQDNGTELLLTFDGQTAQTTTYYFRTHFNFTADPASSALELTPEIDDGAIFYLNGVEILSLGMDTDPEDPRAHATLASQTVGDGGPTGPYIITSTALKAGDNVLAVEVHQSSATSSDVWMAVKVKTVAAPANVTITTLANGNVEVSWTGPAGCVLVESDTVDGVYTPVAGNPSSPYTTTPSGQKFYQLSCP